MPPADKGSNSLCTFLLTSTQLVKKKVFFLYHQSADKFELNVFYCLSIPGYLAEANFRH